MSIFKGTFKPFVIRQILTRQALLSDGESSVKRSSNVQLYTGGRTAWAKMSSFVDYSDKPGEPPTSALARKYILEAGTLLQDLKNDNNFAIRAGVGNANGSYGSNLGNRQLGLRPIPGITSVNVVNVGAYGSLRKTTITFKAWDKKQLDDLEVLYMRAGYPVLIEWGWSMYMDTSMDTNKNEKTTSNSGDVNLSEQTISSLVNKPIKSFTDPTINPFNANAVDQENLYDDIMRLNHKFSGNYDGMVGIIQNFTWELMANGSYDCTTILISMGDTLDSIKMNRPSKKDNEDTGYKTSFSQLMSKLAVKREEKTGNAIYNQLSLDSTFNDPNIDIYTRHLEKVGQVIQSEEDMKTYQTYIQMSYFIALIRSKFGLLEKNSKPVLNIEIPAYGKEGNKGNGLCLASVDSVSVDPTVCLIGNPSARWVTGLDSGFDLKTSNGQSLFRPFLSPAETYKYCSLGQIGNIYLNVQHINRTFNNMVDQNKNGDVHIYSFLKILLDDVSSALGGINDFDVFVEDNRAVIIDKHYTEISSETNSSKKFQLNIFGTNSFIRNFKILSKIFQSQSNMIAIAAGNSRLNLGGVNTSTQQYFNRGLKNRLLPELTTQDQKSINSDELSAKKEWASSILDLQSYLQKFLVGHSFPTPGESTAFAKTTLNSIILNVNSDANYRSVIPVQVELILDGISGITIGEVFKLNPDMIPKEYSRKDVGFIVKGIQHSVAKSDWTTTIEAYMTLLNQTDEGGKSNGSNSLTDNQKAIISELFSSVINDTLKDAIVYFNVYKNIMTFVKLYYENELTVYLQTVEAGKDYKDSADNTRPSVAGFGSNTTVQPIKVLTYKYSAIAVSKNTTDPILSIYAAEAAMLNEKGEHVMEKYKGKILGSEYVGGDATHFTQILNPLWRSEGRRSDNITKQLREVLNKINDYNKLSGKAPELYKDIDKQITAIAKKINSLPTSTYDGITEASNTHKLILLYPEVSKTNQLTYAPNQAETIEFIYTGKMK